LITNNIFVDAITWDLAFSKYANQPRDLEQPGNTFTKNIIYSTKDSKLFLVYEPNNVGLSDYNLFYTINPESPNWNLQWWKEKYDFDEHSIEADPLFVDYDNDDFSLMSDSWAFNIGFQQIDLANVGPRPQDEATPPKGDLNLDGTVNIQDVQCCVNHIQGTQDWGSSADIDGNGEVNENDLKEIINIILRE